MIERKISEYHPRAWTWTTGEGPLARQIAEAESRLQNQLSGTGLHLAGRAVIEAVNEREDRLRLSWKVFSEGRGYPNEEAIRG